MIGRIEVRSSEQEGEVKGNVAIALREIVV